MLEYLRRPSLIASCKPYHGLGNRLRMVLSAQSLAETEGRHFAYSWPVGRPFGARFTDLWQYPEQSVSPLVCKALTARYPYRDQTAGWRSAARDERLWQVRTAQPLELPDGATPWTQRLRQLRLEDAVAARVRGFYDAHLAGRPYVGVMIRAHEVSHAQSRTQSPVEWFVQRMDDIRAARPDVAFFVSCDVPEVQQQVSARIPDVFGQRDKGAYNSTAALSAAVVDLYLLASSTHILGPHYSSFPELAQFLADDRIQLETSMTPPDAAFELQQVSQVADPLHPGVAHAK